MSTVFRSIRCCAVFLATPLLAVLTISLPAHAIGAQEPSGPIVITRGGIYSGYYVNTDPTRPAVTILTDQAVTLVNSVVVSSGNLIQIEGVTTGANVHVQNVTGLATDPGVSGQQRGEFIRATKIFSLIVQNCTMSGVSFGVDAELSTVTALKILNNVGTGLEDRASDGHGGLTTARPAWGHFIFLSGIVAPHGAEIGWNKMVNTVGVNSTEDPVNIYKSYGYPTSPATWINVHDNYVEGFSSFPYANYNGTGFVTDGGPVTPVSSHVIFQNNEVVHTSGSGVAIASGNNVTAIGNRVVSCGVDGQGNWIAAPFVQAVYIWNYQNAPNFQHNFVSATSGGVVRPTLTNEPIVADSWANPADLLNPTNSMGTNNFTDPCIVNGVISLEAEDAERAFWAAKQVSAGVLLGDQHPLQ